MKKFIAGLLAGILLALSVSVYAESGVSINVFLDRVKVVINGKEFNKTTILYNNETYVPLKEFANALGLSTAWSADTATAYITEQGYIDENLPPITQEESDFIDAVFNTLYEIQYLYKEIDYWLGYTEEPQEALLLMSMAVDSYNDIFKLSPPKELIKFKAAINNYCNYSNDILKNLIKVSEADITNIDAIYEAFAPLYESETLINTEQLIYDELYAFLTERSGWN